MAGGIIGNLMFAVGFKVADKAIRDADKQLIGLKANFGQVGIAAAAAAAAVIGVGAASLHAASELKTSMSAIQMATGATNEQMEVTEKVAKNLYSQNFGQDWNDLGSSIATVQQITGQAGDSLEETTRDALLLRDAFGIEIKESARAAKTMIENFGISSKEAFNLVAQGTQQGLDFSGELIDTINEYSLQFKALGFTADDMFNTMASGAKEGAFNLDKVADAVKEFGIRTKDAGDSGAVEAFEMLGLNAEQMMGTFAAGGANAKKAFTQIINMIEDIEDPVAQNTVAVSLFGTQFEDLQKDVIVAMGHVENKFDMTKDSMGELNKIKFNKPGEAFSMFQRQLETGLLIPIGEKLLPYLTQFGQWLSDNQGQIVAIGQAIGDYIGQALTTIAEKAKEVYSFVSDNWPTIKETVIGLGTAVVALKASFAAMTIVSTINKLFRAFRTGTLLATVAQWGLNTAMLANPMTWIAVGIAAVITGIVLLVRNWDIVKAAMARFWNWTKGVFGQIGSWFSQRFNEAVNGIKSAWSTVVSWFSGIWEGIKGIFASVGEWFGSVYSAAVAAIQAVWSGVSSWFSGVWEGIKGIFATVGDWFGNVFTGAYEGIKTAFGGLKDWFSDLWTGIESMFNGFINTIIKGMNFMINGINSVSFDIPDFFGGGTFGANIPNIPMLAKGGIATGPTLAMIGEGAESEAVLPLSKLEGLLNKPRTMEQAKPTAPILAPARAVSGGHSTIDINMNVKTEGAGANATLGQGAADALKIQLQQIIESAMRQLGLSGNVEVT